MKRRFFSKKCVLRGIVTAQALLCAACGSDNIGGGGPQYSSKSLMQHYQSHGGDAAMSAPRDNDYYYIPVQPQVRDNDSYYVAPRYPYPAAGNAGRPSRGYPTDNDSDYSYPTYWE